jgi:hypothetical protein
MRLIACTFVAALVTSVPVQEPRSFDKAPPSLAWLAFKAAESEDRSQVPVLEGVLASLVDDTRSDQQLALHAVLDALVRLDAKPPLHVLTRVFNTHPVEAVLMLQRFGAERDQTVLSLLQGSKGYRWFALASLLQETRAHGFAAHLLRDLPIRLSVSVSDTGSRGELGGGGLSAGCGDGAVGLARGFPPLASYRFTSPIERGAAPLTVGVSPTYYVRDLSQAGETPFASSCDVRGPTIRDRLAQVAAMLRTESVPLHEIELESVASKDADDLRRRVTAARRRVETTYTTLVESLREDGLLTREDAANLRPEIRIELHDLRPDRSGPLPAMP